MYEGWFHANQTAERTLRAINAVFPIIRAIATINELKQIEPRFEPVARCTAATVTSTNSWSFNSGLTLGSVRFISK
jgi:hypothetical protein